MAESKINDAQRANWGVANAMEQRRKFLNPALRRAYSQESFGEANREGLVEAIECAERIAHTLKAALFYLDGNRQ